MAKKRKIDDADLSGVALVKETARRIRLARTHWDGHRNGACRIERERALALYTRLTEAEKERIPQVLRVWLRYRSEKYFGEHRTPPGSGGAGKSSGSKMGLHAVPSGLAGRVRKLH